MINTILATVFNFSVVLFFLYKKVKCALLLSSESRNSQVALEICEAEAMRQESSADLAHWQEAINNLGEHKERVRQEYHLMQQRMLEASQEKVSEEQNRMRKEVAWVVTAQYAAKREMACRFLVQQVAHQAEQICKDTVKKNGDHDGENFVEFAIQELRHHA